MVKKALHKEKNVAKMPPHGKKEQKGASYSEKNGSPFPSAYSCPPPLRAPMVTSINVRKAVFIHFMLGLEHVIHLFLKFSVT